MKKLIVGILIAFACSAALAFAIKPEFISAEVIPSKGNANVRIPLHAAQVAQHVFKIGNSTYEGKPVEGYIFVHYKKGYAKPSGTCGNGVCESGENAKKCPIDCGSSEPDTSSCYDFMARGAKWKTVESYLINPSNSRGLDESVIASNFISDISKWESATGQAILGTGTTTSMALEADTISPDGLNEAYFGSIDEPGAIAITIVWGVFGGAPKNRELVEWDQVYDEVDFDWSLAGDPLKMDFESIATHELGHSIGLSDLYTGECAEQTMYGYASEGETKKRTLEAGDVKGASELYK